MEFIDLTISVNYVSDWRTWEGARELIQNAIDREREDSTARTFGTASEYAMTIDYSEEREILVVSNENTTLELRTLLLGEGSKTGDDTIGQHGEGYKLALLALLRCQHDVEIHNGSKTWRPRIVRHKTMGADVLRIEIEDNGTDDEHLTFVVSGVSPGQWAMIQRNVRRLRDPGNTLHTEYGELLTDASEQRRLYVGGLFVSEIHEGFLYGYDFDPRWVKLDRDRKTVDSFDVKWYAARMLNKLDGEEELVLDALKKSAAETEYLLSRTSESIERLSAAAWADFRNTYGDEAIPVANNQQMAQVRESTPQMRAVVVTEGIRNVIVKSAEFLRWLANVDRVERETPAQVLRDFLERNREYFPQPLADRFREVIERAEHDGWGI